MSTFKPNFEKLDDAQKSLWPELAPAAKDGFVLYGGTALSLRLGHRTSIDFDFFNDQPLDKSEMRKQMPFLGASQTIQEDEKTLSVTVNRGGLPVRVSFFGGIGIGRVGQPEITEDGVSEVASALDLAATKVKVILQRPEAKDYRDILALVAGGIAIEEALAAARAMYGMEFQASEALKALTYFGDGDLRELSKAEQQKLIQISARVEQIPEITKISEHLGLLGPQNRLDGRC